KPLQARCAGCLHARAETMSRVIVIEPLWRPGPALGDVLLPKIGRGTPTERRLRKLVEQILLMAGSWGDYAEGKILDQVFGATAWTAPGTLYFGLWGSAGSINDASTGGTTGEVSGGSYARVAVTNNTTNFPAATGTAPTTKKNGTAITFPTATANWNSS